MVKSVEEIREELEATGCTNSWLVKREIKSLPDILGDDERIIAAIEGFYSNRVGVAICTQRRILFVDKGMLGGLRMEEFPLSAISSIRSRTGLLFAAIEITVSGRSEAIDQVQKKDAKSFVEKVSQQREAIHGTTTSTAGHDSAAAPSLAAEIASLAKLHESGALTDDEFASAKRSLIEGR